MAEDLEQAELTLRKAYDAFNRGDFDAAVESVHPEIEWERVAEVEGKVHGREAVRQFMQPDVFASQKAEIVEITSHEGDKLLVHARFKGSFSGSGIELEQAGWQLWTIRDGLGGKLEVFLDRDQALEAAGPEI